MCIRNTKSISFFCVIINVRSVKRSELTAETLGGVNKLIGYVSAGIILILLAVSIFLISNTVTMGISVRSEEIQIMKYVGATDFFVRAPFVVEGIIIGLVGALIPLGVIQVVYNRLLTFISEQFAVLTSLLNFLTVQQVYYYLMPISLILGGGIGFLGSFITVRKHLRV